MSVWAATFAVSTAARGLAVRGEIGFGSKASLATFGADILGGGGQFARGFTFGGSLGLRQGGGTASQYVLGRLNFFAQHKGSILTKFTINRRYTLGSQLTRLFTNGDDTKSNNPLHGGLRGLGNIVSNDLHKASNSIKPQFTVDTTQFNKALAEYMKYTKKTATEVVNSKALFVAIAALKNTYKADPKTIRAKLNEPSKKFKGMTAAEAFVFSTARKNKQKMSKGEFKKEVRKFINTATGASAFLKSGWLPAIRTMSRVSDKKAGFTGVSRGDKMAAKKRGKDKGGAKPALAFIQGNIATSEVWNSIVADNDPKAMKYKVEGLNIALNNEAKNMMAYVEKKQQEVTNKFNAGRI